MSDDEWPFLDEVTFVLPDGTMTSFGAFVEWVLTVRPRRVVVERLVVA